MGEDADDAMIEVLKDEIEQISNHHNQQNSQELLLKEDNSKEFGLVLDNLKAGGVTCYDAVVAHTISDV